MQLLIVLAGIILLLFLIVKKRIDAFISLLIVSLLLGLLLGQKPHLVVQSIETGVGSIMGTLALILGLGAMIGQLMEESGAANSIATTLINKTGTKYIQWAVLIAGMIISLALFFDTAFILVIPIVLTIAKKMNVPALWIGMPTAISLLTVHALFPPHPGPVAIIETLHVHMGKALFLAPVIAVPSMIVAGIFFPKIYLRMNENQMKKTKDVRVEKLKTAVTSDVQRIPFTTSIIVMTLPIILISIGSILQSIFDHPNTILQMIILLGNPVLALLITLGVAIMVLGIAQNRSIDSIMQSLLNSSKIIAAVLLINGAGGGLKQVLMDTGTINRIVHLMTYVNLSPILAGFFVAALMRVILGSATVSAITAASVVNPMMGSINCSPELVMLSIGAGSMFFSHVNDPGFWLFKQYLKLDLKDTFKTWSAMTVISSLTALCVLLIISLF
jgi:GntP family gluconate:H+ symporter/Gnt-I system high-affinity gluconate transporter